MFERIKSAMSAIETGAKKVQAAVRGKLGMTLVAGLTALTAAAPAHAKPNPAPMTESGRGDIDLVTVRLAKEDHNTPHAGPYQAKANLTARTAAGALAPSIRRGEVVVVEAILPARDLPFALRVAPDRLMARVRTDAGVVFVSFGPSGSTAANLVPAQISYAKQPDQPALSERVAAPIPAKEVQTHKAGTYRIEAAGHRALLAISPDDPNITSRFANGETVRVNRIGPADSFGISRWQGSDRLLAEVVGTDGQPWVVTFSDPSGRQNLALDTPKTSKPEVKKKLTLSKNPEIARMQQAWGDLVAAVAADPAARTTVLRYGEVHLAKPLQAMRKTHATEPEIAHRLAELIQRSMHPRETSPWVTEARKNHPVQYEAGAQALGADLRHIAAANTLVETGANDELISLKDAEGGHQITLGWATDYMSEHAGDPRAVFDPVKATPAVIRFFTRVAENLTRYSFNAVETRAFTAFAYYAGEPRAMTWAGLYAKARAKNPDLALENFLRATMRQLGWSNKQNRLAIRHIAKFESTVRLLEQHASLAQARSAAASAAPARASEEAALSHARGKSTTLASAARVATPARSAVAPAAASASTKLEKRKATPEAVTPNADIEASFLTAFAAGLAEKMARKHGWEKDSSQAKALQERISVQLKTVSQGNFTLAKFREYMGAEANRTKFERVFGKEVLASTLHSAADQLVARAANDDANAQDKVVTLQKQGRPLTRQVVDEALKRAAANDEYGQSLEQTG